jgi:hypothetical protein
MRKELEQVTLKSVPSKVVSTKKGASIVDDTSS